MRTFADRLGVTNPTISGYESGKILPSRSMLLLIYRFAETEAEKQAISHALGGPPESLNRVKADSLATAQAATHHLRSHAAEIASSGKAWRQLQSLVGRLPDHPEAPLWLVQVLHLWHLYRDLPSAESLFWAAADDLAQRLEQDEPRSSRAAKKGVLAEVPEVEEYLHAIALVDGIDEYYSDTLPRSSGERSVVGETEARRNERRTSKPTRNLRIMSLCPTHKKWFDTGSRMTRQQFESSEFEGWKVDCPHCLMPHTFDKAKARLQ